MGQRAVKCEHSCRFLRSVPSRQDFYSMHLGTLPLGSGPGWCPVAVPDRSPRPASPRYPQSVLEPRGEFARITDAVFMQTVWWAVLVFVLVQGALLYAMFRFRGRPDDAEPAQVHGNTTLEIIWTIIPAVILAVIAVPTVKAIFRTAEVPGGQSTHRGGRSGTSGGGSSATRSSS